MNQRNFKNNLPDRAGSSPAFRAEYLEDVIDVPNGEIMTVSGTINKTAISLFLVLLGAMFTWNLSAQGFGDMVQLVSGIGFFIALILGFVIIFKRQSQSIKFLVPIYALAEGALLGGISYIFEGYFPGVVHRAIEATLLCLALMLGLYKTGLIKVNETFRSVVILSTFTIFGIYLIDLILHFFGISVPMINTATPWGIGFSILVVAIAAFNLLLDFDFIEQASQRFLPKHTEWYGAFGLMVTLVWLYIELLKLLAKLQRRD